MYQDFFNKNDDYLNEFKQKVANQKIATLEERRTELARSRNNFLGTFAGVVLAGIVGWCVLAPQYAETNKEIPIIRRPQTAVKIKPENPGGMEIPNQDKDVYNIVEKKNVDNTVVENLLPTPEKPKLPDIVAEEEIKTNPNADNLDEIVSNIEENNEEITAKTTAVPEKPQDLLSEKTNLQAETGKEEKVVAAEQKNEQSAPKEQEAKSEKTAQKEQPAAAKTDKGAWQIQLIVSKSKEKVEQTWTSLSSKYTDLKKYSHEVQSFDLGSQGIVYRLRAGSFASKDEASAACAALKAKGLTDCIAKER